MTDPVWRQALSRANSELHYWRYRRKIGSPVSLLVALCAWPRRYLFELKNINRAERGEEG